MKQLVISQSIVKNRDKNISDKADQTLNQRENDELLVVKIEKAVCRLRQLYEWKVWLIEVQIEKISDSKLFVFNFSHPLNFIDILFSASHLSITLRNSSREMRSSSNCYVITRAARLSTLTSEISISSMNLSAILFNSFCSIPSTIWASTVNSSS